MKTRKTISRFLAAALLLVSLPLNTLAVAPWGAASVRLKDLVRIQGVERRELVGYGVVVGLNGSGDKDTDMAKRTISNLMKNFNIFISEDDITSKNVAMVMVTASVDPFHRKGDRVDVQVASMGDASSLYGGVLLMTPLLDGEGQVYATAQGALVIGGYSIGSGGPGGQTETKNFPTVGRVLGGATVQFDDSVDYIERGQLDLVLQHADFTTAQRIAEVINANYPAGAVARDAGSVEVRIPADMLDVGLVSQFISSIEVLRVTPDVCARIVVNERTGTVVMGGDVRISTAIVAHGNLTVRVGSSLDVSQPQPFSRGGQTVVTEEVDLEVEEDDSTIMLMPQTTSVQELAEVLNQLGASPRDLVCILEALHKLGALQMEIITL